jgi:hypothetical protein
MKDQALEVIAGAAIGAGITTAIFLQIFYKWVRHGT